MEGAKSTLFLVDTYDYPEECLKIFRKDEGGKRYFFFGRFG